MESDQILNDIGRMQGSIEQMRGQLATWEQRVAELREDRAGLVGFQAQVSRDQGRFESTLAHKRQAASLARRVSNSRIAEGIAHMMDKRFDGTFQGNVTGCFSGVQREIASAIRRIDEELRELRGQIAATQEEVAHTRGAVEQARADYERARAQERQQAGEGS